MNRSPSTMLVLAATIITTFATASVPAAETSDADATRCVTLTQIRSVDIIDKRRILFRMTGDVNYLNELPYECPGLYRDKAIMYRTSLNQLCNVDIITVLDNVGGEFRPGASCGLGAFRPVTEDEIKSLREKPAAQQ